MSTAYPDPCCRCGFCCLCCTCPTGQKVYRVQREDRCPGLSFEDGLDKVKILICALALGETQALFVLGLGAGCCIKARALAKGVTYDFAILPPHIKRAVAHAMRTDPKLLTERRPVPSGALAKTGRDFWLFAIVESLARGALSNN